MEQSTHIWKQQQKKTNKIKMEQKTVKKIKIFQFAKKNMAVIGFNLDQPRNNHRQFNGRQKLCLIYYFISIIANILFILVEANGIEEYMLLTFIITTMFAMTLAFISLIYTNDKMFSAIEICEMEINISK